MTEREKYDTIYRLQKYGEDYEDYGNTNHGRFMMDSIASDDKIKSILDVGCGHNQFIEILRMGGKAGTGIDFACPGADYIMDVLELKDKFEKKQFDMVTSFDTLEHLLPEQINDALKNIKWCGKRFAFSIAFKDSMYRCNGESLHPTVKSRAWWISKIQEHGGIVREKGRIYLTGRWKL